MSDNIYRRCAKCGASRFKNPELKMHRFPVLAKNRENVNRLRLWAKFCFPEEDWTNIEDLQKLHKSNKVLCGQHFATSSYTGDDRSRLLKCAIPVTEEDKENISIAGPSGRQCLKSELQHLSTLSQNKKVMTAAGSTVPDTSDNRSGLLKFITPASEQDKEIISVAGPSGRQCLKSELQHLSTLSQNKKVMTAAGSTVPDTSDNRSGLLKFITPASEQDKEIISVAGPSEGRCLQFEDKYLSTLSQNKEKRSAPSGTLKLKHLNVTRVAELTPREQQLFRRCKYLLKVVRKLKALSKNQKNASILNILNNNEKVIELFNHKIGPSLALLLQGELQNGQRRLKGRRWTKDNKFLALEMYKKSPTCYKLLCRLFCLPSISTIRNLLNQVTLKPGINKNIFQSLKKLAQNQTEEENICSLIFDEMSIRKNLQYNSKLDLIEGYQDHGKQGRSAQTASHALVFMLVGIRKKWKQPVAYYLSGNSVTADRWSVLIKEVLEECLDSGLHVVSTICDMDGVNVKALGILGSTVEKPYFEFKGQEIVNLPDPPHLLKCFRNLFLKYDVKCTTDLHSGSTAGEGTAKWSHIKCFYELDNKNPHFVFAPALTKHHLDPNGKQKMRVKLAAQVFSHSVAAGIFAKIATNELPAEAATTANFLSKFDQLFDAVNADSADRKRGKPYSTNMTEKSPHLKLFEEMTSFIKKIKFIGARTPPSQLGWLKLLNAYVRLWGNLRNKHKIKSVPTRRLTQDPVENLFGCIRQNCGSNNNPTVSQFIAGLKTAVVSNLRNTTKNKNCEDDNAALVENFKSFFKCNKDFTRNLNATEPHVVCDEPMDIDNNVIHEGSAEAQACTFVCGYIFKRINRNCEDCKKAMLADIKSTIHTFTEFKEYTNIKHSLHYVNVNFLACAEKCAEIIHTYVKESGHMENIKENIDKILEGKINFDFLKICSAHYRENVQILVKSLFVICIKRFCVLQNRKFSDEAARKSLSSKIRILKNN